MFKKVLIFFSFLFVFSGCIYNDEPMPRITYDYTDKVIESQVLQPTSSAAKVYENIPRGWLPASRLEKKWTAIVIHHSATKNGNTAIFDKWHKDRKHWEGVGYNFVIGNGTDSGNGQVEVTYRWLGQKTGAHCGGTPGNWANRDAVGICLVGDFNRTLPTFRQMQSLSRLVRFLQYRYGIPKSRIYGHNTTPGAGVTDCPGKYFPMARLKAMLDF